MARSKRKHNLKRIEINSKLMLAVKRGTRLWIIVNYTLKSYFSDHNSNLAYVPAEYISSTDAQRAPFFLSEAVSDFV